MKRIHTLRVFISFIIIIMTILLTGCSSVSEYPAVNVDASRYEGRALTLSESENGFYVKDDKLILTYAGGKYSAEFPEKLTDNISNRPAKMSYDHILSNTGISVSDSNHHCQRLQAFSKSV